MFTGVSDIAANVDRTMALIFGISIFFLVFLTALMVYFVWRYSAKRNPNPSQIHGHLGLEVLWTVVPFILAMIMFAYGYLDYEYARSVPDDALVVKAEGRMWSWSFTYPNGKRSPDLYLPVGKPVKIELTSADVLHSLYIPAFRLKGDTVPGFTKWMWFTPEVEGEFDIMCAEYCGLRHSYMLAKSIVVPEPEFKEWMGPMDRAIDMANVSGQQLMSVHGCIACHSTDGSKLVGPSYKGLYGSERTIMVGGAEQVVVANDDYIRKSIMSPQAEVVKGYPPVMPLLNISEPEIDKMIGYIKTLK